MNRFLAPHRSQRIWRRFLVIAIGSAVLGLVFYFATGKSQPARRIGPEPRLAFGQADGGSDSASIDCVGVTEVLRNRGIGLANSVRFGESNPTLRTAPRLGELAAADLRAFCDWDACVENNGYAHTCSLDDGGGEHCRVCESGTDCDGNPLSQDDCVAHAQDTNRSQCHVGLLQECILQRELRGPQDKRVTLTCQQSEQACAGQLPGDLSTMALAAQHETDQVTVEVLQNELNLAEQLDLENDGGNDDQVRIWKQILTGWEGGLPVDVDAGS